MKRLFVILSVCIILIRMSVAQDVKVTSAFDSARIYIGDQINYTVTVDKPANLLLDIPQFKDSLKKNIEILRGPVTDTARSKDGRVRIIQRYLITSFDSGFYQIPPVYAELKEGNGIKRFYSDYTNLEVSRVRIAPRDTTAKIFDIVKPYRAPLTAGEVLPWVLLGIVVLAITWFLVKYLKSRRGRQSGEVFIPNPDPAHVIAFRQLELLRSEKLWEKGAIKNYYSRLSEIVRQYLENRYGVYSLELTTYETLYELKKTGIKEDDTFRKLKAVLTGADLVKFAKYNPDPSENEQHFKLTWEYVDETKFVPQVVGNVSDKNDGGNQK
jgi:hypothetical protein